MSWTGFKKAASRAGTQVMMKTGHVERTTDREYEVEERRYRTLESAALRLQKEAKGYLDSLRAMTASQMRIAETIDAFYGESGAKDGVSRSYKQAVEDLDAETVKALDGPYRTTVLEPINRFCAYFPDINECIKKRNHKMLDYDAMRSKVKKLVEKPDKDPSKLPRTEKEMEMVSMQPLVPEPEESCEIPDEDLTVPSPPKVLDRIKHVRKAEQEHDHMLQRLMGVPDMQQGLDQSSRSRHRFIGAARTDEVLPRSLPSSIFRPHTRHQKLNVHPALRGSLKESCVGPAATRSQSNTGMPPYPKTTDALSYNLHGRKSGLAHAPSMPANIPMALVCAPHSSTAAKSPFFHPSELELLIQPFKQEYLKRQADNHIQAKAAYDQLNEQLTTELPQLIDLRVPYLDPSFEALVKIQLRFCAEAYSRMAQVQQYLDASTRDQYASGDLDARVEDVLGQIRELSIAGTV